MYHSNTKKKNSKLNCFFIICGKKGLLDQIKKRIKHGKKTLEKIYNDLIL